MACKITSKILLGADMAIKWKLKSVFTLVESSLVLLDITNHNSHWLVIQSTQRVELCQLEKIIELQFQNKLNNKSKLVTFHPIDLILEKSKQKGKVFLWHIKFLKLHRNNSKEQIKKQKCLNQIKWDQIVDYTNRSSNL